MQKQNLAKKKAATPKKRKKQALGRGLAALIPTTTASTGPDSGKGFVECDIDLVSPNLYQPRTHFAADELEELCESIKTQGIIQPLLVRKDTNGYELVAGERRLRAAKMAGLAKVPVMVKNLTDAQMLEVSIVENIQREDFNPIEEADAYHRLITEFNLTQNRVAERVGKSRSAVANFLRLRQLPEEIKGSITNNTISMGHARALLGIDTRAGQLSAWREIVAKKFSVRQTETLIKRLKKKPPKPAAAPTDSEKFYFTGLEEDLSRHFGTRVRINRKQQKGSVAIEFYSNDDLDRLLGLLKR
ncbi:MAG: Chromosome (plasmid) partitioning protein ParB [Olavius algarvensis Delta 4 endosymbiont]|nr:MAG: Chromosome (plasmid) partitioning protein ParB [Olavius algarvensis Delta 4 endosymbiont]